MKIFGTILIPKYLCKPFVIYTAFSTLKLLVIRIFWNKKTKNFEIPSPFGTWTLLGPFQSKVSLENNFITENSTVG